MTTRPSGNDLDTDNNNSSSSINNNKVKMTTTSSSRTRCRTRCRQSMMAGASIIILTIWMTGSSSMSSSSFTYAQTASSSARSFDDVSGSSTVGLRRQNTMGRMDSQRGQRSSSLPTLRNLQPENDEVCFDNLFLSDANSDSRVDADEYVTFVKLEGPQGIGFLADVTTFQQLPLTLQSNFLTIACLCTSGPDCCRGDNAHISSSGTEPGTTPTSEELSYLNLVCAFTSDAIDRVVVASSIPTFGPTLAPSTSMPTGVPTIEATTQSPTLTETTIEPTAAPTTMTTDTSPPTTSPTVTPAPTATPYPTSETAPVPLVVKSTYSIVVVDEITLSTPSSSYEDDLISAMDVVSQQVAVDVNADSSSSSSSTGQRHLRRLQQGPKSQHRRIVAGSTSSSLRRWRDGTSSKKSSTQDNLRRLEVVVNLPSEIDQNVDVGFTADPLLEDGVFVSGPCPYNLQVIDTTTGLLRLVDPTKDSCRQITSSIPLILTAGEDPIEYFLLYSSLLGEAILNGQLGLALKDVAPDSSATVASGMAASVGTAPPTPSPGDDGGSSTTLPAGAIAGISIGGVALLISIGYLLKSENRSSDAVSKKPNAKIANSTYVEEDLQPVPLDQKLEIDKQLLSNQQETAKSKDETTTVATTPTAVSSDEPTKTEPSDQILALQEEEKISDDDLELPEIEDDPAGVLVVPVPYIVGGPKQEADVDEESQTSGNERSQVSQESEAGWSEAFSSSMGTMSDDEMLPDATDQDSDKKDHIVTIPAGTDEELLSKSAEKDSPEKDRFEQLENAIISNDWVAVGSTATALATMQYDSQSHSRSEFSKSSVDASNVSSKRSERWKESVDAKKAAELDELIEKGDWEGIISAAGRYQTEDSRAGATGSGSGGDASNIITEVIVQRDGAATSETNDMAGFEDEIMVHEDNSDESDSEGVNARSQQLRKGAASGKHFDPNELRQRVLELVQEVVPEELDHVDEMISQFAGREEDLLETLETMKLRASAQGANSSQLKTDDEKNSGSTEVAGDDKSDSFWKSQP